jgi:hypothetical protein
MMWVCAEYRCQTLPSPLPWVRRSPAFCQPMRKCVRLTALNTLIRVREGDPVKALLGGYHIMNRQEPRGSDCFRDPSSVQIVPHARPVVCRIQCLYANGPQRILSYCHEVKCVVYTLEVGLGPFIWPRRCNICHVRSVCAYIG